MQVHECQLDLSRVAELGNGILPRLNALRETAPVLWSESAGGWLVTRHQDVADGFAGKLPLSNRKYQRKVFHDVPLAVQKGRFPLLQRYIPSLVINTDPPHHTRLRKLLLRAFSRKVVDEVRPYASKTIHEILEQAAAHSEIEFVSTIARPITGRVIMRLLGVSDSHLPSLKTWSVVVNSALGAPKPSLSVLDAAEGALKEMQQLFAAEIERRRKEATVDFLSQLVHAREDGDSLTEDEIVATCIVTLLAGHDTTTNTMALGVVALTKNDNARAYLLAHPEDIAGSIAEVMRYIGMATTMTRIAAEDFEWHGARIRKDDVVYLMIAPANRDPRSFRDPETFDLSRKTDATLTFGPGIHHCIGHLLAKMQLAEFFPAFFSRFRDIEILDQRLAFTPVLGFRGLETLNMKLH